MKNYDPNIRYGIHTIKVTFQAWKHKGYVTYQVHGNCKGNALLDVDDYDLYDTDFLENTARLVALDEEWFRMYLTDENGVETEIEEEWNYLNDYIVGVEIIDYVEEVAE